MYAIQNSDEILVLHARQVIEEGHHDDLVSILEANMLTTGTCSYGYWHHFFRFAELMPKSDSKQIPKDSGEKSIQWVWVRYQNECKDVSELMKHRHGMTESFKDHLVVVSSHS